MADSRPPLLARLKAETHAHHARAEAAVPLLAPGLGLAGYRRHLERLFGLYLPLEAALWPALAALEGPLLLARRRKGPLLEADLRALGHSGASLAALPRLALAPVAGRPEALGALYVLEGATLGGQLVRRHLVQVLPGEAAQGALAFFSAYGEETGPLWRTFGQVLAAGVAGEAEEARVVAAACATFDAFQAWLTPA